MSLNQLNYASLEASRRLVEAGIALETEAVWRKKRDKTGYYLSRKALYHRASDIPAPSMAEVWRELPVFFYDFVKSNEYSPVISNDEGGITYAKMRTSDNILSEGSHFENTNPTDALIDLLIWARSRNERD